MRYRLGARASQFPPIRRARVHIAEFTLWLVGRKAEPPISATSCRSNKRLRKHGHQQKSIRKADVMYESARHARPLIPNLPVGHDALEGGEGFGADVMLDNFRIGISHLLADADRQQEFHHQFMALA